MNRFKSEHSTSNHILPAYEITLGIHRLCILSDQSIIMRGEQVGDSEAAQELHLDTMETYRLMMCLREMFQQVPIHPEEVQRCSIDTKEKTFYNE